jgi:tetratricopeptide (TPR) repeat protein
MKHTKLIFLLLLVSFFAFGQNKNQKNEALFTQFLEVEDATIGKKIIDSKDNLYSLYCQGVLMKDPNKKLALFTQFIQLNPKLGLADAYLSRGVIYVSIQKTDSAISNFNKSIEINNTDFYAFFFRGEQLLKLEQNDKAIEDFTKSISLSPDFYVAYHMRGICLLNQKKYKNALLDFNKVIALDKTFDPAFLMRAMVYDETEEYQKAIDDWNQAKKLNKDHSELVKEHIAETTKKMKGKKK